MRDVKRWPTAPRRKDTRTGLESIEKYKVGNDEIFRTWGWPVSIIVSERVKQAMEEASVTGTLFTEV